jgi:hypothetical protein
MEIAALDGCIRHTRVEDRERICLDGYRDSRARLELGLVRDCIAVALDTAIATTATGWFFFVTLNMSDFAS